MRLIRKRPVDRSGTPRYQQLVRPREVPASEESPVRRQWRRVGRSEHVVTLTIDRCTLASRMTSPEQEDKPFAPSVELPDHGIRESFPSLALMGSGGMCAN